MIQLSKISVAKRIAWDKKYKAYYRRETKHVDFISGELREKIRKDFMEKHKLTD